MPFATQAQKDYTAAIHDYAAADVDLTHNLELAMRAYTVFYSLAAASSAVEAGSRSQMPTLDRAEAQLIIDIVSDVRAGQRTTLFDCLLAQQLSSAVLDFVVDGMFPR